MEKLALATLSLRVCLHTDYFVLPTACLHLYMQLLAFRTYVEALYSAIMHWDLP